jgi:hypothetical protein
MKLYRKADLVILPVVVLVTIISWWLINRPSIRSCPTMCNFSPLGIERAANRLIQMGPEKAYLLLRSSASTEGTSPQDERVMLLCRVLYQSAGPQKLRPPPFGGPTDVPQDMWNSESWPAFPSVLSDDYPFLLSEGYMYFGAPPDVRAYVDYCHSNGVFRTIPFAPACWRGALDALANLYASERWRKVKWQGSQEIELKHRLHLQVERSKGLCTHT